jgi:hypothetical protein
MVKRIDYRFLFSWYLEVDQAVPENMIPASVSNFNFLISTLKEACPGSMALVYTSYM